MELIFLKFYVKGAAEYAIVQGSKSACPDLELFMYVTFWPFTSHQACMYLLCCAMLVLIPCWLFRTLTNPCLRSWHYFLLMPCWFLILYIHSCLFNGEWEKYKSFSVCAIFPIHSLHYNPHRVWYVILLASEKLLG